MADPMTVPTLVSFFALALSRDMSEEKSSGAEDPAAMKVAPATSSERFSRSEMTSGGRQSPGRTQTALPPCPPNPGERDRETGRARPLTSSDATK